MELLEGGHQAFSVLKEELDDTDLMQMKSRVENL